MTNSNEHWIGIAEAMTLMEPLPSTGLHAHRARMAGWIIDQVVRLRALEMVSFEAPKSFTQEATESNSEKLGPDDVWPIHMPSPWTQPKLERVTASNTEFDGADLDVFRQSGAFDPQSPFWETGEIPLRHPVPGIDERQTFYGIQVHHGDLSKRLAMAGLAEFATAAPIDRDDLDRAARLWIREWLSRPGGSRGQNPCWAEFKRVPAFESVKRENWFRPIFEKTKSELKL